MNAYATPLDTGRANLVNAFDAALGESRSEIHYQPVVDVDTNRVAFVEALFRCPDRHGRYIGNDKLMPALRDGGRMALLTQHVVLRVLEQAAEWRKAGLPDRISFNLPAELLSDQNFLWWLIDEVVGSSTPPGNVLLEISSESFETWPASAENGIRRLAFAGFRLALDVPVFQFSDLSCLSEWTVHLLKVNRSFIGDPRSLYGRSLLSALYGFCTTIELDWAVVGVENAEEMEILKASGARVMQGFHFARPMSPLACTAWLDGGNAPAASRPFEIQSAGHC
jgi:EAL domain-containing protein (putative c-di-GMP-specific phosphodiesterase class I)